MAENATKCSAADGLTQTFDFCHSTPLMVRAVDFNALHAECQKLRKDAERYRNALVECAEAFEALSVGGGIDAHAYAADVRHVLVRPNDRAEPDPTARNA